jgi:nitrous oxidase accessory protein NosD
MKRVSILLIFLLTSAAFIIPNTFSVKATFVSNSRGLWNFDEGAGTTAHDSSGNGNDGTIYGGAIWVSGNSGKALDFDGTSSYVEVADSDSLDITGKITLEAWIYPKSLTGTQVIICKYNHTALNSAYYLSLGATVGTITYLNKIYFALTYDGNHYYAMLSNTNITANTWTHVAATSNSTHMILYINGVKDKVRTYPPSTINAGGADLRIGCYLPEFGYARFFNGTIDEVRVSAGTVWTVDDDGVQCPNADFTKIQNGVDAASGGDTIFVHDGTYVENVNVDKPLTIRSMSRPIIDGNQAGACITIASDGVTIEGFELENGTYGIASWGTDNSVISDNVIHDILNVPGYAGCGIMFWSDSDDFDNNVITHNEIYNCDRQGIYIGGETTSYTSQGNAITENVIHDNGRYTYPNGPDASAYGIQLSFADSNLIQDNEIYGHDDWFPYPGFDFAQGIYLYDSNDNTITNNNLHNNNYGVGIWRPSRAAGTNFVNYNDIAGNTGYGIRTFDGAPAVDARFNWWGTSSGPTHSSNVGGTGDKIGNYVDYSPWLGFVVGTSPMTWHVNPTGTIQEAIDEASSGDTILVHDGTYNEALYINKNLIIKAASTPIIKGSQLRATNYGNRQVTIFVENAANVVLQDLDVEGAELGVPGGTKSYAILYENSGGKVQNCTVSPNTVGDMFSTAIAAWDNSDLTIKECVIENFGRIGVYSNNATLDIENNTIIGQAYSQDNLVNYGIEVEDYTGPSVADIQQNVIYNCNNTNPNPLWSSAAIVVDAWREWADVYDLALLPSKVSITYNEIYDNYEAIEIVASQFSYAHYNNFHNNAWGVWSAPENWTTNPTYHVFDARYNWWGDQSGPYHPAINPTGLGDMVSDYVDFIPWLQIIHDVAIIDISVSPTTVVAGQVVTINVTVENQGSDYESFTVTAYYDTTAIASQNVVNLLPNWNTTLTFNWNTAGMPRGTYTIKAEASVVPGETDTLDNVRVDGTVIVLWHDVAVTDVVSDHTWVYQGHLVYVNVTVKNQGDFDETVTVTLYYDIAGSKVIGTQITDLAVGESETILFAWDTATVPYCHNYTLTAVATIVPQDNNPTDNTFTDGKVKIRIQGDINGDGTVDMLDVSIVADAFLSNPGDPHWNPDADINYDGTVDMADVSIVIDHFMESC